MTQPIPPQTPEDAGTSLPPHQSAHERFAPPSASHRAQQGTNDDAGDQTADEVQQVAPLAARQQSPEVTDPPPAPRHGPVPQPPTSTPPPTASTGFVAPGMAPRPYQPQTPSTIAGAHGLPPSHASAGLPSQPQTGSSWDGAPSQPAAKRPRRGGVLLLTMVVALVSATVGGLIGGQLQAQRAPDAAAVIVHGGSDGSTADLSRAEGSVADIAAQVLPSVVSIEVYAQDGVSTGSGFVISDNGYILTNDHVVAEAEDADGVVVMFSDGQEFDAEVIGSTVEYDLAVIKVDRKELTPLELGDSDAVVVGDATIAIGAPLGLQGTVTTGIVSALNRPVTAGGADDLSYINAIQTDAAINPGNSGGPLVNVKGEVIGVNSAIAQPPGSMVSSPAGSIGLGFAIGSNQAARTAAEIIDNGFATYPIIGVMLDSAYQGQGVQVLRSPQGGQQPVTPGGPADQAGLQPGDVITAIDDRPVTYADELIVAIRAKAPGDTVALTVKTSTGERTVEVTLDEARSE